MFYFHEYRKGRKTHLHDRKPLSGPKDQQQQTQLANPKHININELIQYVEKTKQNRKIRIHVGPTLLTGELGVVKGVIILTHPLVRKSHMRTVLSCEPLINIAPPHVYRDKTCPGKQNAKKNT